jgi:hypothetical protein
LRQNSRNSGTTQTAKPLLNSGMAIPLEFFKCIKPLMFATTEYGEKPPDP